jgi:hypothetical protein
MLIVSNISNGTTAIGRPNVVAEAVADLVLVGRVSEPAGMVVGDARQNLAIVTNC